MIKYLASTYEADVVHYLLSAELYEIEYPYPIKHLHAYAMLWRSRLSFHEWADTILAMPALLQDHQAGFSILGWVSRVNWGCNKIHTDIQ